jgi:hypothetical protein
MLGSLSIAFYHSRNDFVSRKAIRTGNIRGSFFDGLFTDQALAHRDWRHHPNIQQQRQCHESRSL